MIKHTPVAGVGLSTYAYFWRISDRVERPLSVDEMLRDANRLGATIFQFCDYAPLETLPREELARIRGLAASLGLTIEVGTRGTATDHLERFVDIASALGASLLRSMWTAGDDHPDFEETLRRLRAIVPTLEREQITLALETYEQVSTRDLVHVVRDVHSERVGICLDPANSVANFESPLDVTSRVAEHVKNWHVKDFSFSRNPGWVGFVYTGTALGEGRLAYDDIRRRIDPSGRGINQIIEFWLPWQVDADTTARIEAEWTENAMQFLRSRN